MAAVSGIFKVDWSDMQIMVEIKDSDLLLMCQNWTDDMPADNVFFSLAWFAYKFSLSYGLLSVITNLFNGYYFSCDWFPYFSCAAGPIPMENNNGELRVRLRSSDGQIFTVDKQVAMEFEVIKGTMEIFGEDQFRSEVLPLSYSSQILEKIIEYTEFHVHNSSQPSHVIKAWDLNLISNVDINTLLDLTTVSIC